MSVKKSRRKAWVMPTHVLAFPIKYEDDDGQPVEISEIKLRAFNVAEHRKALAEIGDDSDDQFEALVLLSSGLDEEVIDQLKRPDFVSLAKLMHEYVKLSASYFLDKKATDDLTAEVPLLVPFTGAKGLVSSLRLNVPTLKATKIMKKMRKDEERVDFISAHCTGLSQQEVQMLSCPDWSQLQERLNDFLNKPADFFQSAT